MTEPVPELDRRATLDGTRRFESAARELLEADWNTWQHAARVFVRALSEPPVAAVLSRFSLEPPRVDTWLERRRQTSGAIQGSAAVELPIDPVERTAFLHELWRRIAATDDREIYNLFVNLVGVGRSDRDNWDSRVRLLTQRFARPLVDEIHTGLLSMFPADPPPSEIHVHGGQPFIALNSQIQGSMIAMGNAVISGSTAAYAPESPTARHVMSWQHGLPDVAEEKKAEVVGAIQVLARAVDSTDTKMAPTVAAIETLAESSPTLKQRMVDLYWSVAANLTTDVATGVAIATAPTWMRAIYAVLSGDVSHPPSP